MADEPTLRELANLFELKLSDAREDIADLKAQLAANALAQREQFERYVLTAVYYADQKAWTIRDEAQSARIKRLEDEMSSARNRSSAAIWMAVAAGIGAVLSYVLQKASH